MNKNLKHIPIAAEGEASLIQPVDLDGFREHNRKKSKALTDKTMTEKEAIEKFVNSGIISGLSFMEL